MAASSRRLVPILVLALPLLQGGCAIVDTGAFTRLQQEVVDLKGEVATLRSRPAAPPPAPAPVVAEGEIAAIRRSHADLVASVDQLSTELRTATTRFDEGKLETARTLSRLNDDAVNDRLALQGLQGKVAALEGRKGGEPQAKGAAPAASPPAPAAVAPPPASGEERGQGGAAKPPPSFDRPEDQYDWALGQVKRGNYREARGAFESFLSRNGSHKLAPNALYWKGESYYGEKDYENAIVAFQDVVDRFPDHEKAADAMYKQGLSFLSLKDRKNGRLLFELVVSKHPKSSAAEAARKKLAELPPQ